MSAPRGAVVGPQRAPLGWCLDGNDAACWVSVADGAIVCSCSCHEGAESRPPDLLSAP